MTPALTWLPTGVSRIAVDTMCFIYRFEANADYLAATTELFEVIERGGVEAVCSVLVLTELLTLPMRAGNEAIAASYRRLLTGFPNLSLVPVDESIAVEAASLRATHQLRSPDALHLATGVRTNADVFVTADARLRSVTRIPVVLLPEA